MITQMMVIQALDLGEHPTYWKNLEVKGMTRFFLLLLDFFVKKKTYCLLNENEISKQNVFSGLLVERC